MADIKWIKIDTNIFDDEKIQLIEELPKSDTIIMIWFKLLVLAGKKNDNGLIYITKDIPYDPEKLARIMRRDLSIVRLALETFAKFGMIYIENDIIAIKNWEKHQNIDGMDKIKEQWRLASKKHREKQKLAIEDKSHMISDDGHAPDKNRLGIEKEKNREDNTLSGKPDDTKLSETITEVITYLNQKANTNYKASSKSTVACISARLKEGFTIADMKQVMDKKKVWLTDKTMAAYYRPITLFGTKFESYLNEKTEKDAYRKKYL